MSSLPFSPLDTPPGTSDEHLTLVEYIQGNFKEANFTSVLVTTPQVREKRIRLVLCNSYIILGLDFAFLFWIWIWLI
jgi:hypothetical protein